VKDACETEPKTRERVLKVRVIANRLLGATEASK
jgi:hypothetical protein